MALRMLRLSVKLLKKMLVPRIKLKGSPKIVFVLSGPAIGKGT